METGTLSIRKNVVNPTNVMEGSISAKHSGGGSNFSKMDVL